MLDESQKSAPGGDGRRPQDHRLSRWHVDLGSGALTHESVACEDLEDALGGIARGFKLLESEPIRDAYAPEALLLMNLGCLSGSSAMTGLRTFFHAYSPLKSSRRGMPAAMWSAGSGKFGTQLRDLGIDEVLIRGRADEPSILLIDRDPDRGEPTRMRLRPAPELVGMRTDAKIRSLHDRHPDAHFAVIGPAGENPLSVRYGAIALSTENQLKSGDAKPRFCGRGGMGSVMGAKNLLGIVAELPARTPIQALARIKEINKEIAKGDGSRRFREPRSGGLGGTWANYEALNPSHALPERNFNPTGRDDSDALYRQNVEALDRYVVRAEACFRCGIRCHKNLYDRGVDGRPGRFRAKLDFEPLDLLSSNLEIYDIDQAATLIELADALGLDSISAGVCISYAMEYNARALGDAPLADGIQFGDFDATLRVLEALGEGREPDLGQGVLRLSQRLGEEDFAMQSKGLEFPAYLPQTNPAYPWALAGGHMSMRTYLLLVNERETSLDYWVDAITNVTRGLSIMRDDMLGTCKFTGLSDAASVELVREVTGLDIGVEDLHEALLRTYLRGWRLERRQGFDATDYRMPADAHDHNPAIELPYFNTQEFFDALASRVEERLTAMLSESGLEDVPH